jgi:DNA-binding CsgD family transcriptional regulator
MPRSEYGPLTPLQQLLLTYLAEGLRHKDIARRTALSVNSVSVQANLAARRMGCATVTQAVVHYTRWRELHAIADGLEFTTPEDAARLRRDAARLVPVADGD